MSDYLDSLETRDPQQREAELMARLPGLIAKAQSVPGWARLLQGVDAAQINHRSALAQLPVTHKSDLVRLQQQAQPFGGLNVTPSHAMRRLFMSPGPIFDPQGQGEDWWRFARPLHALGLRAGHVIQNCFSYHFTPAAFMMEEAARKLGCAVIPAGSGQTEQQVQAIAALRPDAWVGPPSFLRIIVERARELGADISSIKMALCSAEALPPRLRRWFYEQGITRVMQTYGTADIGNIAYETAVGDEVNEGMVLDEDLILEIVQPGGSQPVAEGEVGEVVITSFNPDYPMIRFGTGDLSRVLPGPSACGRSNVRIAGWLGRADQATKVRGMFIHPLQVQEIMRRHPQVQRARMVVSGAMSNDRMVLHCEVAEAPPSADLTATLISAMRDITKLRGEVQFCTPGSLPDDGRLIEDVRSYD
ncbi:AMP-binding protein [Massilia sp. W12]|uniref:phenylacetate--CoA ligase family protein n=1 Tax=Massilia sp. W12 TaxID=3126507 RepID=UPI0030D3B64E